MIKTRLYLDTRRRRNDGASQVTLILAGGGDCKTIPLGVYLGEEHWDKGRREASASHPLQAKINLALRKAALTAEEVLLGMPDADAAQAVEAVRVALFPGRKREKPKPKDGLLDAARRFASLKADPATRKTYERTVTHLERFRPQARLGDVTAAWLAEFDRHMALSAPSPNARAIHMRNLRAVFNFAIDEGLTANYPFRRYRIRTVATAKRNVGAEGLRELFTMRVEDWQEPYRDFFMLSFLLIGTNAKDLLLLPPGADKGGRIEFNRSKTKKLYSIRVEPEALEVIERLRGKRHMLRIMDERTDYLQYVRQCNHALGLIGTTSRKGRKPEGEPLFPGLTTYYARHSWATIAASLDIPKDTIAAALGHDMGNSTTAIYIDFDRAKVDEANRRVIDWVIHGKR